ncbi:biotin/lipoyl-binding protein [Actibacterium sp. 188UL27-1]|uniref:biotin/lipoyl-binding protein n=1 Tax=Actibacterium sp. 188UL27-1 TaxID=2786961 RepID=UPI001EF706B0|nr:biotin/lipoyl-binding protein [Actibacterium sp. 188UL27-1]
MVPSLRTDLNILPTAPAPNGSPAWIIHDPIANKFHRIGWLQFEILKRWGLGDPKVVARDISHSTTLTPQPEDIDTLVTYLGQNNLLNLKGNDITQAVLRQCEAGKSNPLTWLVKNYLFVRIPLVRPDHALDRLYLVLCPILAPLSVRLLIAIAVLGAFLVLQDWAAFIAGFADLQTPHGVALTLVVLMGAKVIHELGHAIAAKHHGCRVPAMGVAFIVLWPLLWTDTTEGWKLRDRWHRLAIDGGGVIAELGLAAIASILWAVSPDGSFKMAMHVLASVSWITTLAINLNPFMRFDGYYLLADAVDLPNLQQRSFALGQWWLRKVLFGPHEPEPEDFPTRTRRWLIFYAFCTWIYRFFLFLGIALLVYHLFFKALGLMLFVIELWWFIGRPIVKEIKSWSMGARNLTRTWRGPVYLIALGVVGYVLAAPLPRSIAFPAVLTAEHESLLFSGVPAQVTAVHVQNGDRVEAGAPLIALQSAEIQLNLRKTRAQQEQITREIAQNGYTSDGMKRSSLMREEANRLQAQARLLETEQDALILVSPISGTMRDLPSSLGEGDWVGQNEPLGIVVSDEQILTVFLPFAARYQLDETAPITFSSSGDPTQTHVATWERIETTPIATLDEPALASMFGGPISVTVGRGETLSPTSTWFRGEASLQPGGSVDYAPGFVIARTKPTSLAADYTRRVISVLVRESGF